MEQESFRIKQIVDWKAAVWAGLIAGVVFLVVGVILSAITLGSPTFMLRLSASILLGADAVLPTTGPAALILLVGVGIHLIVSILFAIVTAVIIYRWGIIVGFLGGALVGLAIYIINYYGTSLLLPWLYPMRNWMLLVSHVIFGAISGGIYELLEEEIYVVDEGAVN